MVLLEVRSDLDPPRVVGYQLPGRGRRQLRADRILRVEPAADRPTHLRTSSMRRRLPSSSSRCSRSPPRLRLRAVHRRRRRRRGSPLATQWLERAKASYRNGRLRRRAATPSRTPSRRRPNDVGDPRARRPHRPRAARLHRGAAAHRGARRRPRRTASAGAPTGSRATSSTPPTSSRPCSPTPRSRTPGPATSRGSRGAASAGTRSRWRAASVGAVEMPRGARPRPARRGNVVPCELDGERILALVATGSSEVLVDSNSRHEPSWVEPAVRPRRGEGRAGPRAGPVAPRPGSSASPSRRSSARSCSATPTPPSTVAATSSSSAGRTRTPPPEASRVPLYYLRGGGMILRATVTAKDDDARPAAGRQLAPLPAAPAGHARGRRRASTCTSLVPLPDDPTIKRGMVPMFRVGGFDLAKMPAIEGVDLHELTAGLDIDLGGVVGADLLAFFRVTFADDGRFMWIEPDPTLLGPDRSHPASGRPSGIPRPWPGGAPGAAPAPAPQAPPCPRATDEQRGRTPRRLRRELRSPDARATSTSSSARRRSSATSSSASAATRRAARSSRSRSASTWSRASRPTCPT